MRFSILAPFILGFLTILFTWPLLKIGYTSNMGSLEPATLIMARRVAEDGIWGWYHNWYLGFPFRFAGPPLSWWVLGIIQKINLADVLTSYRLLLFASLLAFPISFYFLAKRVFGRSANSQMSLVNGQMFSLSAFISAVVLIFLPSIGYLFPKYFAVGQNFGFVPSWILGTSPSRSLALALLPLVLLAFWNLIEKISYKRLLLVTFLTSVFFLADGVTPYSLLVGLGVILIIEGKKDFFEKLAVISLSLLLAFLIDAFYFTPANIKLIALSPSISGIGLVTFLKFIFQIMLGLGPAILAVWWFKFAKNRPLSFAILWFLPFISLTLLFYFSNPDFLTEYIRFLPELEIGVALLFGYLVASRGQVSVVIFIILLVTLLYSLYYLPRRLAIFKTHPNISQSVEYEIANWLGHSASTPGVNLDTALPASQAKRGEHTQGVSKEADSAIPSRVFLSGSTAFWLNEFAADVWQVRGDIDQASTNRFWDRATYQIRNSSDPVETLNWLKALRVNYAVVHDNNSKEYYHDFKYSENFQNIGQKVYDNNRGDRIYRIDSNLVSTASLKGLNNLSQFSPRDEKILLSNYVEWLENSGEAELSQEKNKLSIKAKVDNDRVIALGVTFDDGWKAQDSFGNQLTISKDPFANMVIIPRKIGQQEITLIFREGADLWAGVGISLLILFWVIFLLPKQLPKILKWVKSGWEEE